MATEQFVAEIIGIIQGATLDDLVVATATNRSPGTSSVEHVEGLAEASDPDIQQEQVQEPSQSASASTTARTLTKAPEPPQKPRKRRSWPTCSATGCSGKMYGPSGKARLCYQHHLEAGGKPSPFARKQADVGEPDEGAQVGPESSLGAKVEPPVARDPGPAPAAAEMSVEAPAVPTKAPLKSKMSIKDLRRNAVDPTVVVRGRGANGRPADAGTGSGALDKAQALFDIPGTGRGRKQTSPCEQRKDDP